MSKEPEFTYYFVLPHGMPSDVPEFFFCPDVKDVSAVLGVLDTHMDDPELDGARITIVPMGMTAKESLEIPEAGDLPERLKDILYPWDIHSPGEVYDRIVKARKVDVSPLMREIALEAMHAFKRYETLKLKRKVQELELKLAAAEKAEKGRVA